MTTITVSRDRIRHALGHFATGVTVVTSRDGNGEPVGTTASAFSSLSLDPPLVLVCLDRASTTLAALRDQGAFAINVLSARQRSLSGHFARRGGAVSWEPVVHRCGATGMPLLDGALLALGCELEHCLDGGDHEIVVGRPRELELSDETDEPLLHYRGAYASLAAS
jgi:3-hydroxy-9,10-secoandrosta-1,3,5(10)-triene-9,17-dione monooxygenase reductase component